MARQWIRQCRLIVGNGSQATDLSDLRIRFSIEQKTRESPGVANIFVSNISADTANRIQKEYDRVVLEAGYEENAATIFEGEIVQKRVGRENPTDTYVNIIAKEAQQAYSFGVISKTLAAGHTLRDQVDACLEALKPYGVTAGFIADLPTMKMPRGRAMFGMAREQLRWICKTAGCSWFIRGNKLNIVKNNDTLPGDVVVLNSRTGMIGMPVQTMGGIEVRCLINPAIKAGAKIKIDQSSIQTVALQPTLGDQNAAVQAALAPTIAADGIYKVLLMSITGDTRGTDWYQDLVCIAVGTRITDALARTVLNPSTD